MSKKGNYYRVMRDGFAIYRCSPRPYVSVNLATLSFSSKMLPGNVPVEQVPAPKVIRVSGEAWGTKVTRTYLEGERPVTHTVAYKGRGGWLNWDKVKAAGKDSLTMEEQKQFMEPADPNHISFDNYSYTSREQAEKNAAYIRENIESQKAGTRPEYSGTYSINDVQVVELKGRS
jgi:hypothetical protein